jgi:ribonuclease HI
MKLIKQRPAVTIFTDGSCKGNQLPPPRPGGYAAILRYIRANGETIEKVVSGYSPDTTSNRMELQAVIAALELLAVPCNVQVVTDSRYVMTIVNGGAGKKNKDLIRSLRLLQKKHRVHATKVVAHTGHEENERCDSLSRSEWQNRM